MIEVELSKLEANTIFQHLDVTYRKLAGHECGFLVYQCQKAMCEPKLGGVFQPNLKIGIAESTKVWVK